MNKFEFFDVRKMADKKKYPPVSQQIKNTEIHSVSELRDAIGAGIIRFYDENKVTMDDDNGIMRIFRIIRYEITEKDLERFHTRTEEVYEEISLSKGKAVGLFKELGLTDMLKREKRLKEVKKVREEDAPALGKYIILQTIDLSDGSRWGVSFREEA